ncbi:ABC transporter permease [Dyadobacter aurulentus]|uniref:ABC transporter permease n=1 Tax=Dyadobacter sp. UC 10 TaxID=2605428 RepID=UPI0011F36FB1|nr:ABC transporter permease [Dyadobacter sp. UC 10]KAA0989548.1 FtsX-like permease family protein [Dyadobacter sp. UC 10]
MLKTFLKIAFRHLWRTRIYAFINISGLAIGLTCLLLATIYILDEQSFDSFHQNNPDLYRITTRIKNAGKSESSGGTGQVQGPAFQSQIPEIRNYARIMGGDIYGDIRNKSKVFKLQMLFVDSTFFEVFTFKILSGNQDKALQDVNSVVITRQTALKFFGRLDVVGEILRMSADPSAQRLGKPLVITAVVQDPPVNSSIQFDVLFPFRFLQLSFEDTNWLNAYLGTFVVLQPHANLESVTRRLDQIGKINAREQLGQYEKEHGIRPEISYGLQQITDIHLNPQEISNQNREAGVINGSRPIYSFLFFTVAGFILFMASINFINISISASVRRAREIGIRKVTGSKRAEIFLQFIGESAFVSLAACILALLMTIAFLPIFNQLAGKQIVTGSLFQFRLLGWLAFIFLFNILLSGAYPAYLLSGFTPVQVLYGKLQLTGKRASGSVLVVFQFTTAIVLGIVSLVFYLQMRFIKTKDLGYNPQEVVKVAIAGSTESRLIRSNFESNLKNNPDIGQLSLTGEFGLREAKVEGKKLESYYRTVDERYLEMLEMQLKTGRNFSQKFKSDPASAAIVNEAFVKAAGLDHPVGKIIQADSHFGEAPFTIIGVVQDFHYASLKARIQPLVMLMSDQFGGETLLFKINHTAREKALSDVGAAFHRVLPEAAFSYTFLDDLNAKEYDQEKKWQVLISYATAISVLVCCLGLFGLAHLALYQRTKETGIRLVLGATALGIIVLFSRDFFKIIAIAILIACPAGYYLMNLWLGDFSYRIPFPYWVFPIAGTVAIIVTLLTVGTMGARAAAVNPALSLRSE